MKERTFEVRDMRVKEKFFVDDAYLNGYARLCGANATLVYLCLCRHADRHQESFPSVKTMADKTGISKNSVMRGIAILIEWNIISKERERKDDATWLNNRYVLKDKSEWKTKPSPTGGDGYPSPKSDPIQVPNEGVSQVPQGDLKDTHRKGYTYKDIAPKSQFVFTDYLSGMDQDPKRYIQIVAFFFKEKNIEFDSIGKVQTAIMRHLRPAKQLEPFSDKELVRGAREAEKQFPGKWTLETVVKMLTK